MLFGDLYQSDLELILNHYTIFIGIFLSDLFIDREKKVYYISAFLICLATTHQSESPF